MLLLFQSTHDVICAEKQIRKKKLSCKVIPVPRSVSSRCGMALEVLDMEKEQVIEVVQEYDITVEVFNGAYQR